MVLIQEINYNYISLQPPLQYTKKEYNKKGKVIPLQAWCGPKGG